MTLSALVKQLGQATTTFIHGDGFSARMLYCCLREFGAAQLAITSNRKHSAFHPDISFIPETELPEGATVLVSGQFSRQIIDRLSNLKTLRIIDCSETAAGILANFKQELSFSPLIQLNQQYPENYYRQLLENCLKVCRPTEYSLASDIPMHARLYMRHDIDYPRCVARLPFLLDCDLEYQLKVASFIRTDGLDYKPETLTSIVYAYKKLGIPFGLHTSCYTEVDYRRKLQEEIDTFASLFGFLPEGITFHGLGDFNKELRIEATLCAWQHAETLGVGYADHRQHRLNWQHTVQDCNLSPSGQRLLLDDVIHADKLLSKWPIDLLILTHPCYW